MHVSSSNIYFIFPKTTTSLSESGKKSCWDGIAQAGGNECACNAVPRDLRRGARTAARALARKAFVAIAT